MNHYRRAVISLGCVLVAGCRQVLGIAFDSDASAQHIAVVVSDHPSAPHAVADLTRVALGRMTDGRSVDVWSIDRAGSVPSLPAPLRFVMGVVPDSTWRATGVLPAHLAAGCYDVAVRSRTGGGTLLFRIDTDGSMHQVTSCSP
jgi:hypothetical protein